jgi:mono/diheme cytochrome c family protein
LHNEEVLSLPRKHCAVLLPVLFLAGQVAFAEARASQLPEGPGKETVQKICSGCHAPEIVLGRRDTKQGWEQVVNNMVDKGANGTDEEFNTIIDYLAAHFPQKSDSKSPANESGTKSQ